MSTTAKERKKEQRIRLRALGLVPKEIWVYPQRWEEIKKMIERINKK